jgi:hypothetical protein
MWWLEVDASSERCDRARERRERRPGSRFAEGVRRSSCAPARSCCRKEAVAQAHHRRAGCQAGHRRGHDSRIADARAEPAPAPGNDTCADAPGVRGQAETPKVYAGRTQAPAGPAAGRKDHA